MQLSFFSSAPTSGRSWQNLRNISKIELVSDQNRIGFLKSLDSIFEDNLLTRYISNSNILDTSTSNYSKSMQNNCSLLDRVCHDVWLKTWWSKLRSDFRNLDCFCTKSIRYFEPKKTYKFPLVCHHISSDVERRQSHCCEMCLAVTDAPFLKITNGFVFSWWFLH